VLNKTIRLYLAAIGRRGGEAGRGESKVRGGRAYYREISAKGAKARARKRRDKE